MQLMPLEKLEQLIESEVDESFFFGSKVDSQNLGDGLTFSKVEKAYETKKKQIQAEQKDMSENDLRSKVYEWMKSPYLKSKCPPIKFIGQGSSRTAYACLGGKCLKVAKTEAGAAQNKHEMKHTKKRWWKPNVECFIQSFSSSRDYGLLLTECCSPIDTDEHLSELLGLPRHAQALKTALIGICQTRGFDIGRASELVKSQADELKRDAEFIKSQEYLKKAEMMKMTSQHLYKLSRTSEEQLMPGQRSLVQLVEFWKKNGVDELLPGDVARAANWGIAIRRNQLTPVLIDVGFSERISNRYY